MTAGTGRVALDKMTADAMGRQVIPQILGAGYSFDAVDDGLLDRALDGRYKAVVLANVERMPLASLEKLERFASAGGVVVAARRLPALATGYQGLAEQSAKVKAAAARLFAAGAKSRLVENEEELGATLQKLVAPDVRLTPANAELGFAHRSADGAEIYFVANTSNQPYRGRLECRAGAGAKAEWFNPLTGASVPVTGQDLELAPYESRVIVFSQEAASAPAGSRRAARTIDASTGWKVSFDGLKKTVQMEKLRSWSDDEATKFYSGEATYEKQIQLDAAAGARVSLDFGPGVALDGNERQNGMRAWLAAPVRDAAIVYVNGKRAGSVWTTPYRLDISAFVTAGANAVRIVVANTALNALAGQGEPDYRVVTARFGERFQMQDMRNMKPEPAGLLGALQVVLD